MAPKKKTTGQGKKKVDAAKAAPKKAPELQKPKEEVAKPVPAPV